MKKFLALFLALVMVLSLVACGQSAETPAGGTNTSTGGAASGGTATGGEAVSADGKCACGCGLDVSGYSEYIQSLIYNAHVNKETLSVYGACDEAYVNAAAYHFQELFNIPTTSIRYATGEMVTRITEEADNPQADVLFGGSNDYYIKAKEAGLLLAYQPENEKNLVDSRYIDPDYQWVGIYSGVLGILVNTEELDLLGYEAPTTWAELTDPKWQGLISIANPNTSATATNFLATMHYVYGYPDNLDNEGLMQYFAAFDKNVYQYTKSGSGPSKMIGPGEIVVGICFLHDGIAQIANGYDNIQLIVPSEGSGYEIGAAGIVKNDANPNAAKLFIEYCLSAECVNLGKFNASYQIELITAEAGAEQPEDLVTWGIDDLSKCNLVNYDVVDVAPKLAGWTEEWMQVINNDGRLKTE